MYKNPYAKLKPSTRRPYTEIYLIRHCHPDYSLEKKLGEYNMPLSKTGLKQREHLTKKLLGLKIDKVYSSSLTRSQETAALYLRKTDHRLHIDERLDEIDWKDWYRLKYFNMSEKTRENKLKRHQILDKELDRMQAVARRAIADIFHHNRGQRVAIFSHGNFIRALLTGILNADVIGFLSLEIFQSSISKIVIDRDGYIKISFINNADHLPTPPTEDLYITLAD
jgi:broad specificity phosphatase PhoE